MQSFNDREPWEYSPDGAIFSSDRKDRFVLWRIWNRAKPIAMCIGINPSNANERNDDPTIRLLKIALKKLDFGGFIVTNLYSVVSSNKEVLLSKKGRVKENLTYLKECGTYSEVVIFCWGSNKSITRVETKMIELFPDGKCFGKNSDNTPIHPRRLSYLKMIEKPSLQKY